MPEFTVIFCREDMTPEESFYTVFDAYNAEDAQFQFLNKRRPDGRLTFDDMFIMAILPFGITPIYGSYPWKDAYDDHGTLIAELTTQSRLARTAERILKNSRRPEIGERALYAPLFQSEPVGCLIESEGYKDGRHYFGCVTDEGGSHWGYDEQFSVLEG